MSEPIVTKSGPQAIPQADYYEVPEELHVYSWSPDPDPHSLTPPTQVHLHFGKPPGPVFVVRFKGTGSLDAIIDALIEHRTYVFGPRKALEDEVATLRETVRWIGQTVHQAHHTERIDLCFKSTCQAVRKVLAVPRPAGGGT